MPQDKIRTGPLQSHLPASAFGDPSGLGALGRGIGSFASLGTRLEEKKQREANKEQKQAFDSARIRAKEEATIFMREAASGEELANADESARLAFDGIRNSDYIRDYEERFGETPGFLEEIESDLTLFTDAYKRDVSNRKALSNYTSSFTSLSNQVMEELDPKATPRQYSEAMTTLIDQAIEHKDNAIGPAQARFAESQVNSIITAAAESAPTADIARELLAKSTLNTNQKADIFRRVQRSQQRAEAVIGTEIIKEIESINDALLEGEDVSDRIPFVLEAISDAPENKQLDIRSKFAENRIRGQIPAQVADIVVDGDTERLDTLYGPDGVQWDDFADGDLISANARQNIRRQAENTLLRAREPGALARILDNHRDVQTHRLAAENAATPEDRQEAYETLQSTLFQLYKTAGVQEPAIIPVADFQIRNLVGTWNNPQSTQADKLTAMEDYLEQTGPYALDAISNIGRYSVGDVSDDQIGVIALGIHTAMNEGVDPQEFFPDFIEAQSPGFVKSMTGDDALYKGLKNRIRNAYEEGPGGGFLRDLRSGMVQSQGFSQEVSAGFQDAILNYAAFWSQKLSNGNNPEPAHVEGAMRKVSNLMADVITPMRVGNGDVLNLPINLFNQFETPNGFDRDDVEHTVSNLLKVAANPGQQDENFLTELFGVQSPAQVIRTSLAAAVAPGVAVMAETYGRLYEEMKDSEVMNLVFPGAGGFDSRFFDLPTDELEEIVLPDGTVLVNRGRQEIGNFAERLPKIPFDKMDFLADLERFGGDDPLAMEFIREVLGEKNEEAQRAYFLKYGGWAVSANGRDILPYIKSRGEDRQFLYVDQEHPVTKETIRAPFSIPVSDLAELVNDWKAIKKKTSISGRVFE